MSEILIYTSKLPENEKQNISFLELLLDETWAEGKTVYPESIFSEIGDRNTLLTAKREYEFLLRGACLYNVVAVGKKDTKEAILTDGMESADFAKSFAVSSDSLFSDDEASYRTDCYVAGKYQQELLASGYFNPVMEALLGAAKALPSPDKAISFLEKMISHAPEYYRIDDNTRPFLIYMGSTLCSNVLNQFALDLADALISCHQRVELFDVEKEGHTSAMRYEGQHFKAVIDVQIYLFTIKLQDSSMNFHDLIHGPKFSLILDHPAWLQESILHAPKDYYILTHDRNYQAFAKKYYPNIKDCYLLPPGGSIPASATAKCYDVSFIGSYHDYRLRLAELYSYEPKKRHLAARYLELMRKHPNLPAEQAFAQMLSYYDLTLSNAEFLTLFGSLRQACFCIMLYYREKVIQSLLSGGISLHVYGDSWHNSPFAKHPLLTIHPEINAADSLIVMQQSRICLNIMSWHKDGITERILNSMLCKSVMLSDYTTALAEYFTDGEDLILFDLSELEKLPQTVNNLLKQPKLLEKIALNGYQKTSEHHLWKHRVNKLLEILA